MFVSNSSTATDLVLGLYAARTTRRRACSVRADRQPAARRPGTRSRSTSPASRRASVLDRAAQPGRRHRLPHLARPGRLRRLARAGERPVAPRRAARRLGAGQGLDGRRTVVGLHARHAGGPTPAGAPAALDSSCTRRNAPPTSSTFRRRCRHRRRRRQRRRRPRRAGRWARGASTRRAAAGPRLLWPRQRRPALGRRPHPAARFGGGLSFDGVNDWVTVADARVARPDDGR